MRLLPRGPSRSVDNEEKLRLKSESEENARERSLGDAETSRIIKDTTERQLSISDAKKREKREFKSSLFKEDKKKILAYFATYVDGMITIDACSSSSSGAAASSGSALSGAAALAAVRANPGISADRAPSGFERASVFMVDPMRHQRGGYMYETGNPGGWKECLPKLNLGPCGPAVHSSVGIHCR